MNSRILVIASIALNRLNMFRIMTGGGGDRAEYKLPKSQVEEYNGAEVSLKVTLDELEKYKTTSPE